MKNIFSIKKPIIIFPVIFAFFTLINLYIKNIKLVKYTELLIPGIILLSLFTLIWFITNRITNNRTKTAIITSIFFILFFSFGHFLSAATNLLLRITGIDLRPFIFYNISWKMMVLLIVWAGVFFIFAFFVYRVKSDFRIIIQFMNVASITLLALTVYQTTRETIATQNFVRQGIRDAEEIEHSSPLIAIEKSEQVENSLPNIYYIIVDGYGSANILEKYYTFDNSQFLTFLADKNFYTSEQSHSNYSITVLSLPSSLNLTYLDDVAAKMGEFSNNPLPLLQLIHSNRLIEFLKSQGYTTVAFETGYRATELYSADQYVAPGKTLTAFQSEFINLTPLRIWLSNYQYDSHRRRILYIFDQFPAAANPDQPTFIFAHIISPHPPFVFGSKGEKDNVDMVYSMIDGNNFTDIAGQDEYKQRYKDQVIYLNKLIQDAIDEILGQPGPSPLIIIQGDHGPGSELNWESIKDSKVDERMSILNAYYFPDQNYSNLYENITPVNTFRVILDQYLGTDLGLLEDRSYFSLMSRPYDFIDVTDELNQAK